MLLGVVLLCGVALCHGMGLPQEQGEQKEYQFYLPDELQGQDAEKEVVKNKVEKHSCYHCAYSPPKVYYRNVMITETEDYEEEDNGQMVVKTRKIQRPKKQKEVSPGGWLKCKGPFDEYEAKHYGIMPTDCSGNCYIRRDADGGLVRGCYHGEFGVDQYRLGCHIQAGYIYCFCKGSKCNNTK